MMDPLVSELAAEGIPVVVACRVLELHRQHYYRWRARPVTETELAETYVANAAFNAHRDDPEFGYRLVADQARAVGFGVAERTVWRICSGNGWRSAFGKTKTRGRKRPAAGPAHDDVVLREFTAEGPNQLWLTDLTEHATDLSRWSAEEIDVAARALNTRPRRPCDGRPRRKPSTSIYCCSNKPVLHPPVESGQFRSRKLQQALFRHRIRGSMGQVGSAGDNAAMESFFSPLQHNVLNRRHWATREEPRSAIVTWIERTYHRRRQTRLGRLTPIEFGTIMTETANQAA